MRRSYDKSLRNDVRFTYRGHLAFAVSRILLAIICALAVLVTARYCFISEYAKASFENLNSSTMTDFVLLTARFDLKYSTIAYCPIYVLALLCISRGMRIKFRRYFWLYNLLAMLIITSLSVVNFYYYQTYGRIIDPFFFAFFKEDPWAVMVTLVEDYPLFLGLGLLVVGMIAYLLLFKLLGYAVEWFVHIPRHPVGILITVLIVTGAYFCGMRGSFGTFPVRQNDAQVSTDPLVNAAIPNGPAALDWAWKWYKQQRHIPQVSTADLVADYAALGITADENDVFAPLKMVTPKNEYLENHKPDIVFSVIESMSTHMLTLDHPVQRDLLGDLRGHTVTDYFFTNFLSEGNGTMDSLTRFFVWVPDNNLSTSAGGVKTYVPNFFKPFQAQGYKVVYLTCGTGTWRDIENFIRRMGVDEVIEQSTIEKAYPESTKGAWGIDDEWMYKYALEYLKQKGDQPILLITVSITSHPPYRVPGDHEPKAISLPDEILARFPYKDTENIFGTFRYANDQAGKFFSAIKADPTLGPKTVLVATGDHNLRGIGYAGYPDQAALGHAVPFYMYLPPLYRLHDRVDYEPNRYRSHMDILPTIASHTLSNQELYTAGCDILGSEPCRFPFAYNDGLIIPHHGKYACPLDQDYTFSSAKVTDGLMVDPNQINEDDCSLAASFKKLQYDLYFYQANLK